MSLGKTLTASARCGDMPVTALRIPWKEVDLHPPGEVFATAVQLLARDGPCAVHPFASVLYSGLAPVRRKRPTYDSDGDKLRFFRVKNYSGVCVGTLGGLVVHRAIGGALKQICDVRLVPAICEGVIDVDLHDADLMERLHREFASESDPFSLCSHLGRLRAETHWLEVVSRRRLDRLPTDHTEVNIDYSPIIASTETRESRLLWPALNQPTLMLTCLQRYGLIGGMDLAMSLPVADFVLSMLPPSIWWSSYWSVRGGAGAAS